MALVQSCAPQNVMPDGTCAAPVWVEISSGLPDLTEPQAVEIAVAIAGLWILAALFRLLRKWSESL